MISMLRKETCSGNIHDFAHIPTQNWLAHCLTKSFSQSGHSVHCREDKKVAGC